MDTNVRQVSGDARTEEELDAVLGGVIGALVQVLEEPEDDVREVVALWRLVQIAVSFPHYPHWFLQKRIV